ncbi:MAG: hypothetical protein LBM59_01200 [Ruminococcus sp.]|jgi:hypothetical protein|nr:hypothetical protein [Ruminococcus sp.]
MKKTVTHIFGVIVALVLALCMPLPVFAEETFDYPDLCEIWAEYDDDALNLEWDCTNHGGEFTLFVSDNGKDFKKLVTLTDEYEYAYKRSFTKVYFKVTQTRDGKTLESSTIVAEKTKTGYVDVEYYDTDKDGLNDLYETLAGTDKTKADTDGDGLTDYEELGLTGTDPLVYDSVKKGTPDSKADTDKDGLTNIDEIKSGTNPDRADSDFDKLSDGNEVKKYKTDPLKSDTDGDKVSDGDEVALKLDPLKTSSNGKVPDNERIFKQTIPADHEILEYINSEGEIEFSVVISAAGVANYNLDVSKSGYGNVIGRNTAVIGVIPEFEYTNDLTVYEFILGAKIPDNLVPNTAESHTEEDEELEGIKRFQFFRFFEEINTLLPVNTTYDVEKNMVYTTTTDLGTYCIMDLELWVESLAAAMYG